MNQTELAQAFGPFITESVLGAGQYGTVYRARHREHQHYVALKVLDPTLLDQADIQRKFVREGYATRRFDHRNVVRCVAASEPGEARPWIALELISGVTLSRLMQETVDLTRKLGWLSQLLLGLAHMHARGAVHRDIKPSNLMIEMDEEGCERMVIVDLGLTYFSDLETNASAEEGTPSYLAPELVSGDGSPSVQSDLYAVGVILYELLEGRLPYDGSHGVAVALQQVTAPIPKIGANLPPRLREQWQELVEKSLAKTPSLRFKSADEFREALAIPVSASQVDIDGPSDFSLAIDEALISARHVDETVDRASSNVHVEQWIYPKAWHEIMSGLRKDASSKKRQEWQVHCDELGVAKRFVYHVARSLQTEGYLQVNFPEFLDQSAETEGPNEGLLVSTEAKVKNVDVGVPTLCVFLDVGRAINQADLAKVNLRHTVSLTVSDRGPNLVSLPNLSVMSEAIISWFTESLGLEFSLAASILKRSSGDAHQARLLLEYLLLEGEVYKRGHQLVLSSTAVPKTWPESKSALQVAFVFSCLKADFGEKLARSLLFCGLVLGGAWSVTRATLILKELEVEPTKVSSSIHLLKVLCLDGPEVRGEVEIVFATPTVRDHLQRLPIQASRGHECVIKALNLLMDVSEPTMAEMSAIVWCRERLGDLSRAAVDAERFMSTLSIREDYENALNIGHQLDRFWDLGVEVNAVHRAETWLRLARFALLSNRMLEAKRVSNRVAHWAQSAGQEEVYANAIFQLGLTLIDTTEHQKGVRAMEQGLRIVTSDWSDQRPDLRRIWQLRWVCFWAVCGEQEKLDQSLSAFVKNKKLVSGYHETFRFLLAWMSRGAKPADAQLQQVINTWRESVRLDQSVGTS